MFIFGGVDTNRMRFNDVYQFEIEQRKWRKIETNGELPQSRTFHRSVIIGHVMYVIGGFDGQRLNDLYQIGLPI
jgi:N-acetylneuraminic acid mutarotase